MASIKYDKKTFEKEIGKLTEEMQHKIVMFGTPIESINDDEIELDIAPARPDLLSYQNFKTSFLAFIGKKTGLKKYILNKPLKDYEVTIDSSVKNVRPYTVCAIVKGLKLDDNRIKELIDIQEKLHVTIGRKRKKFAIGIYPLEKIKLPISFKAMEPDKIKFIPLESDREMSGLQILQRHPAGRDYAHLLAGKSKFPFFIDANNNILSMPPIINSHLTGKVTESTKDIFVECSGFDFNTLKKCLNILVASLAEMGGTIYQVELKGSPEKVSPSFESEKMKISIENTNKLLGLKLDEKKLKELLEKMGYNYNNKTNEVEIPAWRTDVLHEVDLIEDIAIAYGYDNLEPEIPKISTIGNEDTHETLKRRISDIISGLGFLEISNFHLTTKDDQFSKMGIPEKQEKEFVELDGSKTEYNIMRKNLAHYVLKIFSENVDSEYPQKIYETGRIFNIEGANVIESENLTVGIAPGNFTEIKQVLKYILRMIGVDDFSEIREPKEAPSHFIDGRVGEIIIEGKTVGYVGEIHPKILRNWKIKMPVALMEISLEEIFKKLK